MCSVEPHAVWLDKVKMLRLTDMIMSVQILKRVFFANPAPQFSVADSTRQRLLNVYSSPITVALLLTTTTSKTSRFFMKKTFF